MDLYKKILGKTTNNKKENNKIVNKKKKNNLENMLKNKKNKLKLQVEIDKKKDKKKPKEKIIYVNDDEEIENIKKKHTEELETRQNLSYKQAIDDTEFKLLSEQIYNKIEILENKIKEGNSKLENPNNLQLTKRDLGIINGQVKKNIKKIEELKEKLNNIQQQYKNKDIQIKIQEKNKK